MHNWSFLAFSIDFLDILFSPLFFSICTIDITLFFFSYYISPLIFVIPLLDLSSSHFKYFWFDSITSLALVLTYNLWFLGSIMISLLNLNLYFHLLSPLPIQIQGVPNNFISYLNPLLQMFLLLDSSWSQFPLRYQSWELGALCGSWNPALVLQSNLLYHCVKYHICLNSFCASFSCIG